MLGLQPLRRIDDVAQAVLIGRQRFLQHAQMGIGIAQIVMQPREIGIEPHGLVVEDEALLGAAFLGEHRRQCVPQDRLLRHAEDGTAQRIDRRLRLAHVAQDAAQIVVTERAVGAGLDVMREHPRRAVILLQVPCDESEIDQQFRIVGIELERAAVGDERLVDMPHPLQRHAEHVIGLGVALVLVGRGQRELSGLHDVAAAPRPDGTPEDRVGFAPRHRGVSLFMQLLELGQRRHLGVEAGQRIEGGQGLRARHDGNLGIFQSDKSAVMLKSP